jgi:hypothetical protein
MLDKQLQEQNEKVASKDDFPINWIDRVSLFLSHTIKYLIPHNSTRNDVRNIYEIYSI